MRKLIVHTNGIEILADYFSTMKSRFENVPRPVSTFPTYSGFSLRTLHQLPLISPQQPTTLNVVPLSLIARRNKNYDLRETLISEHGRFLLL